MDQARLKVLQQRAREERAAEKSWLARGEVPPLPAPPPSTRALHRGSAARRRRARAARGGGADAARGGSPRRWARRWLGRACAWRWPAPARPARSRRSQMRATAAWRGSSAPRSATRGPRRCAVADFRVGCASPLPPGPPRAWAPHRAATDKRGAQAVTAALMPFCACFAVEPGVRILARGTVPAHFYLVSRGEVRPLLGQAATRPHGPAVGRKGSKGARAARCSPSTATLRARTCARSRGSAQGAC